jgi:hypothetical protein
MSGKDCRSGPRKGKTYSAEITTKKRAVKAAALFMCILARMLELAGDDQK